MKAQQDFMRVVGTLCPASRERSLSFTHIEDARMWASCSIAMNERHDPK